MTFTFTLLDLFQLTMVAGAFITILKLITLELKGIKRLRAKIRKRKARLA